MSLSVPQARPRFGVDRAVPAVLDPHRGTAAASLGKEAIAEAVAQLGSRRQMRTAGDPVITRAGMRRIDEEREGASFADHLYIADAEHATTGARDAFVRLG